MNIVSQQKKGPNKLLFIDNIVLCVNDECFFLLDLGHSSDSLE